MRIYRALDPIMIRTPGESLTKFYEVFQSDDKFTILSQITSDHFFLNALQLANPSFYNFILAYAQNPSDDIIPLFSLIKYYSRFTTRPTPFGGFAYISLANWGEWTNCTVNSSKIGVLQTDAEWLHQVISNIENDPDVLPNLTVQVNKNIYIRGTRYINPYVSNCGKSGTHYTSINRNSLVDKVFAFLKNGKKYNELSEYVIKETGASADKVTTYLSNLISNEFILTDLRIISLTTDPINSVINALKKINNLPNQYSEVLDTLLQIRDMLLKPPDIGSSEFSTYLNSVISIMSSLTESNNYIYSFYRRNILGYTIGQNVKKEFEKLNTLFSAFSYVETESALVQTVKKFYLEKYGKYSAVPLTIILEQFQFVKGNSTSKFDQTYLEDLIMSAVNRGVREVTLSEKDLENMGKAKANSLPIAPSFEICCSLNAESIEKLNSGAFEIQIGVNVGSNKLNSHFSRFNRCYSNTEKEHFYNNYVALEKIISGAYKTVNIWELPCGSRAQNISYSLPFYETLDLALYSDSKLSINDITVCYNAKTDRLFFYSNKDNSVIKFISDSMLNPMISSFVGRLLKEISAAMELHYINSLAMFQINKLIYVPKIKYGKFILQPETWRLRADDINTISYERFLESLQQYQENWKMPYEVFLMEHDNRILLDLSKDVFCRLLYREVKKSSVVILTQGPSKTSWLNGSNGCTYLNEMVVPFILNNSYFPLNYKGTVNEVFESNRYILPSNSKLIYYKIYIKRENATEFIRNYISRLFDIIYGCEAKAYFIRYSDPDFHFRIRIFTKNNDQQNFIQQVLDEIFTPLVECGFIGGIEQPIYEREIERYGNKETIVYAEDFFCADSRLCLQYQGKEYDAIFKKCIHDVLSIMNVFFPNDEILYNNLNFVDIKPFRKKFYSNRAEYLSLTFGTYENKIEKNWMHNLKQYIGALNDESEKLQNSIDDIMFSVIHMHCNRISGDQDFELLVLAAAKLIIKNRKFSSR